MTVEQKNVIRKMRHNGRGYTQIASALGISENTVKSWCRRHGLTVVAPASMHDAVNADLSACKNCGKHLIQIPKQKPRRFCSEKCRAAWWNAHRELMDRKTLRKIPCACCGREFDSYGNTGRKYCSHGCYTSHRYKKTEDSRVARTV